MVKTTNQIIYNYIYTYIYIYGFLYGFLYVSSGSRFSILFPSRSTTVVLNDHEAMMQFTQAAVHLAKDWPFSGGGVVLLQQKSLL